MAEKGNNLFIVQHPLKWPSHKEDAQRMPFSLFTTFLAQSRTEQ